MSKLPLTKKLDPLKSGAAKPVKTKKDDIKSFIDSEITKFKVKPTGEKLSVTGNISKIVNDDPSKSMNILKENMKKIKDLSQQAKITESTKNDDMFKSSVTKFPGFKMPENKSAMKNPEETFNSSSNDFLRSSSVSKNKNPFTMKKFEDVTDNLLKTEIINDLNKGDNVSS